MNGILKKRMLNIELLRIASILMIIGLHYLNGGMGGALAEIPPSHPNFFLAYFFESYFIIGVNLFVLITGFFQSEKREVNSSKLANLIIVTIFYSLFFYLIALALELTSFNLYEFKTVLLPFFYDRYWFVKVYIILMLLTPYINIIIASLKKKEFERFLIVLLILFFFWPSFFPGSANTDSGYGVISFVVMYLTGAYLRKHYKADRRFFYYFAYYFMFALITFFFSILSLKLTNLSVWNYNFIFNFFSAVFLFLAFTRIELTIGSKIINFLAGCVFGIYLIHTNISIRELLYKKLLHTDNYWFSIFFVFHFFASILIIFCASVFIEMCRVRLFALFRILLPNGKQKINNPTSSIEVLVEE